MNYFKYWVKEKRNITVDGAIQTISLMVGSAISKEDASQQISVRAQKIEQRIAGKGDRESYEAVIKEFVHREISSKSIITVTRYGALVLNTEELTFLDLDDYAFSFWDLFKPIRKLPKKERIVAKFKENLKKFPALGEDFRIYETAKGIRIMGKFYFDPKTPGFEKKLRLFNVDWLYLMLTEKQNCYRARLTPKPYRMPHKTIKIKSPLDCETDEYRSWAQSYEQAAKQFSVVRLVETIGSDFSSDPIVKMHDELCGLSRNKKLV